MPRAFVRLTDAAVEDLERLARLDPQILRQALKKMLLLEREPRAGEPLLGGLVGFRKLTVGDRHWRIVWRVTTDDLGAEVVEIAEVWAAGARSDGEVYAEMNDRVEALPASPRTTQLAEVVGTLGRHAEGISVSGQPGGEPVPQWLADRLIHSAGISRDQVEGMAAEEAMQAWERFITGPGGSG